MNLDHLEAFVEVSERGSMTAAARSLRVSQPALSMMIQKLEDSIEIALFDRHGKGATPTPAGRLLLPKARALLRDARSIEQGLSDQLLQGRGTLRVGAIPTMAPYLLPKAIQSLRHEFPDSSVSLIEAPTQELVELVTTDRIDIAIASTPIHEHLIETTVVGTDTLVAAAPEHSSLASMDSIEIQDLIETPRIVLGEQHCLGKQVEQFCAHRRIGSMVACTVTQLQTALDLVAHGVGYAIVPELAVKGRALEPGLSIRPLAAHGAQREISLLRRSGRTSGVLTDRFIQLIRASMKADAHGSSNPRPERE